MTTATPQSVPSHLAGKLSDFRTEPDGQISFADPSSTVGLTPEDARIKISPLTHQQTFDPQYRREHFSESMEGQYAPNRTPVSRARMINDSIASALRGAFNWGTTSDAKAVGTVGLLSALAGGVGGYMLGDKMGDDRPSGKALIGALLAGGLGAAGTAYSQRAHGQRENYMHKAATSDVTVGLIRLLENDPSLSSFERARLLQALAGASDTERKACLGAVAGAGIGIGAGALLARFMQSAGLLPMLSGGILGSIVGRGSSSAPTYNALGQLSITNYLPK